MKKETYMNTLLHFDQMEYGKTLHNWKIYLLPHLNHIADLYNKLSIGLFNQTAFEDIAANGAKNIIKKVTDATEKEILKLKINSELLKETLLSGTEKQLQPLQQAIAAIPEKLHNASFITPASPGLPIYLEDVLIVEGTAIVNEAQLRKRFETRIENEKQNAFYLQYLNLCTAWDQYVDFLKSTGYDVQREEVFGYDGFIYEGNESKLFVNHQHLNYFK